MTSHPRRIQAVAALLLLLFAAPAFAAPGVAPAAEPQAERAALDALWPLRDQPGPARRFGERLEAALAANPEDPELLWRAARWHVFRSMSLPGEAARKSEAALAWRRAEQALALAPESIPVRYWAALSAGAWGQSMGVLNAVRRGIEGRFRSNLDYVIAHDPQYDGGSALVALGRYYYELPWPKRDTRRATRYLQLALKVNPDNLRAKLYLAEVLAEDGRDGAKRGLALLEEILAARPGGADGPEQRQVQSLAGKLKPRLEEKLK